MPWFVVHKLVTDDAITWMVISPGYETEEQAVEAARVLGTDDALAELSLDVIQADDSSIALLDAQGRSP